MTWNPCDTVMADRLEIPEGFLPLVIVSCRDDVKPYDAPAALNAHAIGDPIKEAGVDLRYVTQRRWMLIRRGTGPGGRLQPGDGDLPPHIHLIVPADEYNRADALLCQQADAKRRKREAELEAELGPE